MASREGVPVQGFDHHETDFSGYVSVQRLHRQLGKSDVSVQMKAVKACRVMLLFNILFVDLLCNIILHHVV